VKEGRSLVELAQEVERQQGAKLDLVADTRDMRFMDDGKHVSLVVGADQDFAVNDLAHEQMAVNLGIPMPYYRRMLAEEPGLLSANVNTWLWNQPTRRMVRTLDGTARAILSDRYRRLDNFDMMTAVLPTLLESQQSDELAIVSSQVTDRKLYLKATTPRLSGVVGVGDPVQAGIVISNSEVGQGAVSVMPLLFRLICLNGAIMQDMGMRLMHLGRRIAVEQGEPTEVFADETLRADDTALWLKLRDVVKAALTDERTFGKMLDSAREKAGVVVEHPKGAVEVLAQRYTLTEGEQESVLTHLLTGGQLNLWGLANAVTRASQDAESYDRATDLEQLGGKVLTLPRDDWRLIAEAA
jgi:hypothetical protein